MCTCTYSLLAHRDTHTLHKVQCWLIAESLELQAMDRCSVDNKMSALSLHPKPVSSLN